MFYSSAMLVNDTIRVIHRLGILTLGTADHGESPITGDALLKSRPIDTSSLIGIFYYLTDPIFEPPYVKMTKDLSVLLST